MSTVRWKITERKRWYSRSAYPTIRVNITDETVRTGERYSLNLEVRMVNGKFKTFEFDVTDQVKGQPRGGVIVVSGLSISNDEGLEGGGSFDVDVDGWGEWVDIPLPID